MSDNLIKTVKVYDRCFGLITGTKRWGEPEPTWECVHCGLKSLVYDAILRHVEWVYELDQTKKRQMDEWQEPTK